VTGQLVIENKETKLSLTGYDRGAKQLFTQEAVSAEQAAKRAVSGFAGIGGKSQAVKDREFLAKTNGPIYALIGNLKTPARIDIQQPRQPEQRRIELRLGDDQALLFVLKLDVGAERVDAGADAVLLEVGGKVVKRLGEFDARLGCLNVGGGALSAEVLGDHEEDRFFAGGQLVSPGGIDRVGGGAVPPPEGQVEHGSVQGAAQLKGFVGADVLGEVGELETDGGFQVDAMHGLGHVRRRLRQEGGSGQGAVLLPLRDLELREDDSGILLEREGYGVLERELERFLGESGAGERQE